MVKLHLKQGDESLFLFETTCQAELSELIPQLVKIQNGRLKIERLFYGRSISAKVLSHVQLQKISAVDVAGMSFTTQFVNFNFLIVVDR